MHNTKFPFHHADCDIFGAGPSVPRSQRSDTFIAKENYQRRLQSTIARLLGFRFSSETNSISKKKIEFED